jgi:Protein of unknown function (DUF3224)
MRTTVATVGVWLVLAAETVALGASSTQEATMYHASGTFDVQVIPKELDGPAEDSTLGRFALVKRYHGGLEADGTGQMLTAGSPAAGSAGYVAIETVSGTLDGREGSFALMHRGSMSPAGQTIEVNVVPGSGTGALAGISGTLEIRIEGKQHLCDLAYELPTP